MEEKKILVVDDNTANLTMANKILSAAGMRASCVRSGERAIRFLQGNRPDLILLDIHMPEMDGFETLAAIRGNSEAQTDFPGLPEASKIPVIFLTADDDSEIDADTDYHDEGEIGGRICTNRKKDRYRI